MKVLVTGAGGFIGSHLVEKLLDQGHEVRAFVRYRSDGSAGFLEGIKGQPKLTILRGDIRDYDSVFAALEGAERVFHLAALIGIPYSYENALAYVRTNVEGTCNILNASRQRGLARVLVTSTSEVYGTAQYTPIDEAHPLQPQSPYSASKIGADHLALSYYYSFGHPVVVCRPFNTYGPRQSTRAVIPTIAAQVLKRTPSIRIGSLDPKRDLTYVSDTVDAMIRMIEVKEFEGQCVNIGVGETHTIGDVFERLCKIIGHRPDIVSDPERVRPAKSEVQVLLSNNAKFRTATGWSPKVGLDDGLRKVVEYLDANQISDPSRYHV